MFVEFEIVERWVGIGFHSAKVGLLRVFVILMKDVSVILSAAKDLIKSARKGGCCKSLSVDKVLRCAQDDSRPEFFCHFPLLFLSLHHQNKPGRYSSAG